MGTYNRERIHEKIVEILMDVRGLERDDCTPKARLFRDLSLESIDFLEVGCRIDDELAVTYPWDSVGNIFNSVGETTPPEAIQMAMKHAREQLLLPVPDDLPGVDPFDLHLLKRAVRDLFTVDYLVDFVHKRRTGHTPPR